MAAGEAGEGRAARSGGVWRSLLVVAERGEPFRSALPAAAAGLQRGSPSGRPGAPAVGLAGQGAEAWVGRSGGPVGAAVAAAALAEEAAPGLNPESGNCPCPRRHRWAKGSGRWFGTQRPCAFCEDPDPSGLGLSAALQLYRGAGEAEGPGCPYAAVP